MKIYTKIVLDKDNNIIEEQSYDYTGPIAYCGNGGEDGSAGSSAQEAANFDDYSYSPSQDAPAADYDDSFASQNTSTSSTGFEGSPEMGGSRTDTSGPTYDTSYDSGGADPGVPSAYRAGAKRTDYINPNDTATSYSNNLQAEVRANPVTALVAPLGTLGKVAIQTGMMRSELGLPIVPGVTGGSGGSNNNVSQDSGGDSNNNVSAVRQVNVQGTGLPEPSSFITQTSFPNTNLTVQLYNQMKGLLSTPTQIGLLAVNESPFYDFLKERKLDRRVL
tara:strand:+ start:838 stop:1665 length:828 start_codon:yes stop_codon:yes gene_type:complete